MIQAETLRDCPRFRHGFFTRQGGVSAGIYASLNCGYGSNDPASNVTENRRRALAMIGFSPEALADLPELAERITPEQAAFLGQLSRWAAEARHAEPGSVLSSGDS